MHAEIDEGVCRPIVVVPHQGQDERDDQGFVKVDEGADPHAGDLLSRLGIAGGPGRRGEWDRA